MAKKTLASSDVALALSREMMGGDSTSVLGALQNADSNFTELYKAPLADANGNLPVGAGLLVTTATDGFVYAPTCAGTPTGVPTAKTGYVPVVFDTTAKKIWVYNGSSWIATAALA